MDGDELMVRHARKVWLDYLAEPCNQRQIYVFKLAMLSLISILYFIIGLRWYKTI